MRVLILGAGIAGVTLAFELLRDGHEVGVIDRQPEPARETSFANAGLVAVGHALAWASPRAPGLLLKSLAGRGQAFRFRFGADPALWRWSLKFLRECTTARMRRNTQIKHRLCRYAQARLRAVADTTGIPYDGTRRGLLYLYRSQESLDRGAAALRILKDAGQEMEVVDRERAAAIDPALSGAKHRLAGAIFCPTDESGDARKFTCGLARLCQERGARFIFDATITGFERSGDRIEAVLTDRGREPADLYVLALGSYSPLLARKLGERITVYPVKGYSVSVPVSDASEPPTLGGIDEDNLTAYVRLGETLRMTSTAEWGGYDTTHKPQDFAPMLSALRELFPNGAEWTQPRYWACLRPMTPEGTPVLGRGRLRNLFYNTGHGHMGWTMACGTARIVADLIAGKRPEIPLDGMEPR